MKFLIRFKLSQSPGSHSVSVVGSLTAIGSWDPQNALTLKAQGNGGLISDSVEIESTVAAHELRDMQYKFT